MDVFSFAHLLKPPSSKVIRFIFAGALNTVVGYSIYAMLIYFGLEKNLSLLVSSVLGVIFNYLNFGKTVFHVEGQLASFARFIAAYIFIYIQNLVVLDSLTNYSGFDPYVGQIVCLPINVLISWLLLNKWVFKRESVCQKEN